MAVMMHVKSARPNLKNPLNGKPFPEGRAVEVPVTSATMRLVNQGLLIREAPKRTVAKKAKADEAAD